MSRFSKAFALVACAFALLLGPALRAELIVHLPFDGDLEDVVGPNEGRMIDAGLFDIDPVYVEGFDGTEEGAVRFDENSVVVYEAVDSEGTLPLTDKPEFSIAMWVRLGLGGMNDRRVFSESSLEANPLYNLGTDNTGNTGSFDQFIRNGAYTTGHVKSAQAPFVVDEWHHIAYTTNADGETKVYIDGLLDSVNFNYTRQTWNNTMTTIGGILRATTCCLFSGDIDDVRLYDHILSAEEVSELTCPDEACPAEGDTHCDGLLVTGPDDGTAGNYTVEVLDADDDSGDSILYTYRAEREGAEPLLAGPTPVAMTDFQLDAGEWTITVSVDDTPCCDDVAADATCETSFNVESIDPVMLSHWTFDGHTEDEEGDNDGVFMDGGIEGDPVYVEGADGNPEGAIRFDGLDDIVVMENRPDRPLTLRPQFSIALWTKGDGTVDNVDDRVFSESNTTTGEGAPLFNLGTHNTGADATLDVFIRTTAATPAPHWHGTAPLFDNTWHHMVYTDDNGVVTVYIDGVLDEALSRTYVRPTPAEQPVDTITVGGIMRGTTCCLFTGDIDDVRIYNYILDADEAIDIALNGRCVVRRTIATKNFVPGDSIEVELSTINIAGATTITEIIPEGLSVSDAGGGAVNGNEIEFSIDADSQLSYTLDTTDFCETINITGSFSDGAECAGDVSGPTSGPICISGCFPPTLGSLSGGGTPMGIIVGPIALDPATNADCFDGGNFSISDYLVDADGNNGEFEVTPTIGDELTPDFLGEAGGIGISPTQNLNINPRADEGILTAFFAQADQFGYINYNLPENFGDPVDNYVVYSFHYINNISGDELPVTLEVGSDDGIKVIVNGELLFENAVCRGVPGYGGGDMVPAELQPGMNTVVIGVVERGGGTGVRLVVRDEFGDPLVPFDEDEDLLIEFCSSNGEQVPQEVCDNGEDDDGDGDIDCADSDCAGAGNCEGESFVRGDADASGSINLTDGVNILLWSFQGGSEPACLDAADTDNSGAINLSDPIRIFQWLFLGGAAPVDPTPAGGSYLPEDCGVDTGDDAFNCAASGPVCGA